MYLKSCKLVCLLIGFNSIIQEHLNVNCNSFKYPKINAQKINLKLNIVHLIHN